MSGHWRLLSRLRTIGHLVTNLVNSPVAVLCYHRVTARAADMNSVIVSPDNFRAQLVWLKQHYRIVRFEEEWPHGGEPAIAITFDDGYADNLVEALPILEELGLPATFFISTGHLDSGGEFWWDTLERLVTGNNTSPSRFALDDPVHGAVWDTRTSEGREAMFRALHPLFLAGTEQQRKAWLGQVVAWSGSGAVSAGCNRLLTGSELQSLARSPGVTIGAHSVTHPRLAPLSEAEQRREIVASRERLTELLSIEIPVFAYPFGKQTDFNAISVGICREAGFRKAAAAFPGLAHRWTDPFMIPRLFVYNWTPDRLAVALKRFWL